MIPLCVTACLWIANTMNIGIIRNVIHHWYSYNAVPAYLMSLGLLDFFIHVKVKNPLISKAATKIAPLTLGVYLIHAHADVSPWMWEMLNMPQYMEYWSFPLVQIGVTVGVFMVCICLDSGRNLIFKKLEKTPILDKLNSMVNHLIGHLTHS